jgi:hypothetical protein
MTQENLEIVLNRANCCIAEKSLQLSKLWSIGNKCYKEELRDLKILNDSVDTLLSQAFTQNSVYQLDITATNYNLLSTYIPTVSEYIIIYTNNEPHNVYGDGVKTLLELITDYIESISGSITISDPILERRLITIILPCDINSFNLNLYNTDVTNGSEYFEVSLVEIALPGDYFLLDGSGNTLSSTTIETTVPLNEVIDTLLNSQGVLIYTEEYTESAAIFTVETNCEHNNLQVFSNPPDGEILQLFSIITQEASCTDEFIFNNIQSGICQGCLTEEQINTLIEQVMKICSICNCELDNL